MESFFWERLWFEFAYIKLCFHFFCTFRMSCKHLCCVPTTSFENSIVRMFWYKCCHIIDFVIEDEPAWETIFMCCYFCCCVWFCCACAFNLVYISWYHLRNGYRWSLCSLLCCRWFDWFFCFWCYDLTTRREETRWDQERDEYLFHKERHKR